MPSLDRPIIVHLSDVHRAVAILAGFHLAVAIVPRVALLFVRS
jgi:hypothetical protein